MCLATNRMLILPVVAKHINIRVRNVEFSGVAKLSTVAMLMRLCREALMKRTSAFKITCECHNEE
jgi:hypothetical protein